MHSYDKTKACAECGDLDGCHIPAKVKRHLELQRKRYTDDGGCGDQECEMTYLPAPNTDATEARYGQAFPRVVCLCGSTRFLGAFQDAEYKETLEGNIVLTIGCDSKSDSELFSGPQGEAAKAMLDDLHKRKIDYADEILVLNVKVLTCCKCNKPCDSSFHATGSSGYSWSKCCNECVGMISYIGSSTRSEIEYAKKFGKKVRYLNPELE